MLQAHSLLWHYLWVAPSLLLLVLSVVMWRRGLQKQYPVFVIFAALTAIEQFTLYAADVIPSVSNDTFWRMVWAGLLVEAVIKFALIGEIFGFVFGQYPSLAKLGTLLIRGVGIVLVILATVAAAYTKKDSAYWIIAGAHLLERTMYLIECGLIVFLFMFAAYFRLTWNRLSFGIAVGLGISASVHLATWALMATAGFSVYQRNLLDFVNMATYHVCVLIWGYYLLVPAKKISRVSASGPSEHNLAVWNQELERLLHQ
jgi:hypothetical protein